ncbi:hypothetical protein EV715DRAFT_213175, partial [Schizophyllum commune]
APIDMICTTHVCKRWTEIALATRSLWSTIGTSPANRLPRAAEIPPLQSIDSGFL